MHSPVGSESTKGEVPMVSATTYHQMRRGSDTVKFKFEDFGIREE